MKSSRFSILIVIFALIIVFCAGFFAAEWWQGRLWDASDSAAATGNNPAAEDALGKPALSSTTGNESATQATDVGSPELDTAVPSPSAPEEADVPASPALSASPTLDAKQQPSASPDVTPSPSSHPSPSFETENTEEGSMLALKANIDDSIGELISQWEVYVERLKDGESITSTRNLPQDGRMITASIIKIYVMAAVYDQINDGKIDEDNVTADLKKMISVSDNNATNRLINALGEDDSKKGFEAVNAYAIKIGCTHTQLNRLMLDFTGSQQNYTTGADCARLLRLIYNGQCVGADYSKKNDGAFKVTAENGGVENAYTKGR